MHILINGYQCKNTMHFYIISSQNVRQKTTIYIPENIIYFETYY